MEGEGTVEMAEGMEEADDIGKGGRERDSGEQSATKPIVESMMNADLLGIGLALRRVELFLFQATGHIGTTRVVGGSGWFPLASSFCRTFLTVGIPSRMGARIPVFGRRFKSNVRVRGQ